MDGKLNQMTRVQQIEKVQDSTRHRQHRDCRGQDLLAHPALWGYLNGLILPVVPDCPEFQGCLKYRQSLNEQSPGRKRKRGDGKMLPAAPVQEFRGPRSTILQWIGEFPGPN